MVWSFPWVYPVRVAQAVFAIIVLGLTAYGLFVAISPPSFPTEYVYAVC